MSAIPEKKSIVIIGAGFGGLRAAKKLAAGLRREHLTDRYRITLIDRNSYHTYTPTLYEAATTSKETANYLELRDIDHPNEVLKMLEKLIEESKKDTPFSM